MRKGKSVIGQPVYTVSDGRRIDSVKDLVLEEGEDGVVALLVSEGGLLNTSTVIPLASVVRFGPAAVMIDDGSSVVPATSDPRVNEILGRQGTLLGSKVISEGGAELGTIADLYFDESSGRVVGYEVSGGLISDVAGRSSYLPFDRIRTIGADAVVTVEEPVAPATATPGASTTGPSGASASGASRPSVDERLVGAPAGRDVTDRTGAVVVASGQVITAEAVQRARTAGVEGDLYDAAGIQRPGVEQPDPGETLSRAAETASDLWARFTSKLSEMTDEAGQRLDAQQTRGRLDAINDAVGRPVTKVFLDRDDSVILDLGDLVTHQAIQRAADAGLLDSLLACVYKGGDVTFARDEMRAGIEADSTVDKASGGASVVTELEERVAEPDASTAEPVGEAESEDPAVNEGGQASESRWQPADGARDESEQEAIEDPDGAPGQTIEQRPGA
jgi:uncharacterized protein YrrD